MSVRCLWEVGVASCQVWYHSVQKWLDVVRSHHKKLRLKIVTSILEAGQYYSKLAQKQLTS